MLTRFPCRLLLTGILACGLGLATAHAQNPPAALAAPAPAYKLARLLIADTEAKATALPADSGGTSSVFVQGVPLLTAPDFPAVVAPFLGRPITTALLNELANAIAQYARKHDRPIAKMLAPTQNIKDLAAGTLRFAVVVGHYNQLAFQGNRWFSSKLLQEKLGIKPGDEIRLSTLEEAINWANTNPFRHVKVLVNDLANQPGKADLIVAVQEAQPLRFAAAYDDTGTDLIGNRRYTGSVQFGNLWGLDHQGSYQYVTTDDPRLYQGHSMDYRAPLPWRHMLQFSAAYVTFQPTLFGGFGSQEGKSLLADLRYTVPLRTGDNPSEFYIGLDFKENNSNILFGGTTASSSKVDTFQATTGFSAVRHDKWGAWSMVVGLNISPGQVNSRNTDQAFQPLTDPLNYHVGRFGARARYLTGTLSLQRLLTLGQGWDLYSRAFGQLSSTNLVGSEQLIIGGVGTVRGYNQNIFAGDQGFVFSTELQAPVWKKSLPFLGKTRPPLETRFIVFYDAARVFYKHPYPVTNFFGQQVGWDDDPLRLLASAGVGVRMNLAVNFSLNFDYGWQISESAPPQSNQGRGHIRVTLSY